jgi:DNA polymerase-3 subunit gamma/tau
MLFFGPPASGKGSAALELARVLSCQGENGENRTAPWNCSCPACARHRYLLHGDLLMLGPRPFAAEITASRAAFLRESASAATRVFFIRAARKLLARFSPVLWEEDPKLGKISPLLQAVEEGLSEFESLTATGEAAPAEALEKLTGSILEGALKLEDDGISALIPIARIRRAAYWGRLAPNGRRKILLIENADRMQEGARNSLLKILEEPPEALTIVLTAQRREAIMPTILSRLRPYRFLKRDGEGEREVIRRVFRDAEAAAGGENGSGPSAAGLVSAYLDSFLPHSAEKLYPLAAFFIASAARAGALARKKRGLAGIPPVLAALGARCGPAADAAGFAKVLTAREVTGTILAESSQFEGRSFPRFLRLVLDLVAGIQKEGGADSGFIAHNDIWRKYTAGAEAAAVVWNQNPALALEALFYRLKEALAAL